MTTAFALIAEGAAALAAAGVEEPRREARLLLAHVLRADAGALLLEPGRPVAEQDAARFREFLARRAQREPFAYLAGRRGFWSLDFDVAPGVLIPRPETELIVETALKPLAGAGRNVPWSILDLGTGTGAILIALLSELPFAQGFGVDVSLEALEVARANAARLGLGDRARFGRSSWWSHVPPQTFDLIVSNPPYIPTRDIAGLDPEVRDFEPHLALDGGPDGLGAYHAISSVVAARLAPGGRIIVEVGQGQADDVAAIFLRSGLEKTAILPDLAGIPRIVAASSPDP
ncbi:MAG: peptide chain release factor N(5)-glutamine methyltransferase [Alphaproteobacteria bacterium]|nr:peptide chain release factor N(5)-glutamine methyltransferase [Alphaproteobacteria bacterium]